MKCLSEEEGKIVCILEFEVKQFCPSFTPELHRVLCDDR